MIEPFCFSINCNCFLLSVREKKKYIYMELKNKKYGIEKPVVFQLNCAFADSWEKKNRFEYGYNIISEMDLEGVYCAVKITVMECKVITGMTMLKTINL